MGKGGRGRGFRTKILKNLGSGWLPSSEEQKEPSFVSTSTKLGSRVLKNGKELRFVRVGFRSLEKVETRFIRSGSGGFSNSEVQKITKIRKFWVDFRRSEEKKPRFISKSGGFPNSEEQKIKIHKIGWIFEFQSTEKNQDSFWVDFQRSEEKEPRFVSSGRLPSSGKQKKIKIRLGGFSTNG
ncbi:hypothetical protein RhiirC2_780757 [Rhizophagus irregularis]|uniref:Uncharacterized protein n=1 Tax=Rhizophagus irregularis TaxID=588596 RepID=A0A2N1N6U2_9GLOM|nr:hypothetical protein RhiirC2_780757 [Rhizophagus irregularis]